MVILIIFLSVSGMLSKCMREPRKNGFEVHFLLLFLSFLFQFYLEVVEIILPIVLMVKLLQANAQTKLIDGEE